MHRQERPRKDINTHHVFFEGRVYRRSVILQRLRNHHGLIVPINIADHRDLHHELQGHHGVPTPSYESVRDFLEIVSPYEKGQDRTQTLDEAIGFFALCDEWDTAEHLIQQREFIIRTELPYGIAS